MNYPKWFNVNYQPLKPEPPPKMIFDYKEVQRLATNDYSYQDFTKLPAGTNCLTVKIKRDYYEDSILAVQIIFAHKQEVPNPNYQALKNYYDECLKVYEQQLQEWHECKKHWEAERAALRQDQELKEKEQRRQTYLELKKEFE
jgi:hypothetical protein